MAPRGPPRPPRGVLGAPGGPKTFSRRAGRMSWRPPVGHRGRQDILPAINSNQLKSTQINSNQLERNSLRIWARRGPRFSKFPPAGQRESRGGPLRLQRAAAARSAAFFSSSKGARSGPFVIKYVRRVDRRARGVQTPAANICRGGRNGTRRRAQNWVKTQCYGGTFMI